MEEAKQTQLKSALLRGQSGWNWGQTATERETEPFRAGVPLGLLVGKRTLLPVEEHRKESSLLLQELPQCLSHVNLVSAHFTDRACHLTHFMNLNNLVFSTVKSQVSYGSVSLGCFFLI